jgi:hypothetical protein
MDKTLTPEAKIQLASSLRRRYQAASSRTKKQRESNELCEANGKKIT